MRVADLVFQVMCLCPSGILTNTTSLTVECWVTQNPANTWAEIWDFGQRRHVNFALIPYP